MTQNDSMSRVDPPTGLPNQAAFCEEFHHASDACHANQEPIALAMLNLGLQGDPPNTPANLYERLIPLWVRWLTTSLRATDYLARWNADALVLLLSGEDAVGATRAVERAFANCRQDILDACGEHASRLSLCAGISSVPPGMGVEFAITSAERYLISAMSAGGNRVVSSDSRLYRRPVHALVLIDDKLLGRVIQGLLDHEEWKVVHANDLDAALEACGGRRRFQLIVIDECLAHGDGFKALEKIKAQPGTRTVPTIMLLAELSEPRIAHALKLGANDYVGRPFSPLPFLSRVHKLLAMGISQLCATLTPRRILIIDHSLKDLILAGTTLDQNDRFTPYLAYDAKDAAERLATQPVDIILAPLDMLKKESGGGLNLCGTSLPHDIAIVGIGEAEDNIQAQADDKRISGVIRKPFNALTLTRDIEQLTGISSTIKTSGAESNHISDEIQRLLARLGPPALPVARPKSPSRPRTPDKGISNMPPAYPKETESDPGWKWL